eukprot:m.180706 g.180706  ORF g.180706 m.180706 type:complete len:106 (-) comp16862_c0_seq2:3015-3332(-)
MPPKDKKKQIKDVKQAEPILLEYLKRQNRPYNANDLYANLHEAISKTVVVKALASMGEANIIREKRRPLYRHDMSRQSSLLTQRLCVLMCSVWQAKDLLCIANRL